MFLYTLQNPQVHEKGQACGDMADLAWITLVPELGSGPTGPGRDGQWNTTLRVGRLRLLWDTLAIFHNFSA